MDQLPFDREGQHPKQWAPSARSISYQQWLDQRDQMQRVVIHFWAEWNMHDRRVDQLIAEIRQEFEPEIVFLCFNIDQDEDAVDWLSEHGYGFVPRVVGFEFGREVGKEWGQLSSNAYRFAIRKWFFPGDGES